MSLNDLLAKGPNCLGDTYDLFVRYRHYLVAIIGDITKAYYTILAGLLEMHLRRILWRRGDKNARWKVYGFQVVSMGDIPATAILEVVIKKTLTMFGCLDLIASQRLERDRYVDDVVTGGDEKEVERFVGEEDPTTYQRTGTIPQIMSRAGLKFKAIAVSGEPDGPKLQKLGGTVLGHNYSTEKDMLTIKITVNITIST